MILRGPNLQCQNCHKESPGPNGEYDRRLRWVCPACATAHHFTAGMMGSVRLLERIDRYALDRKSLANLPAAVVADMAEGIRALNAGCPRAGIVMLRRALEGAFLEHGPANQTLAARTKWLQENGKISPLMAAQASVIRTFANKYGAHPKDDFLDAPEEDIEAAVKVTYAVLAALGKFEVK